jgi:hypothetical protein
LGLGLADVLASGSSSTAVPELPDLPDDVDGAA